jgi:hypothetical protein
MDIQHNPNHNHLLASLPMTELVRLLPDLEVVEMPLGKVLHEAGNKLQYACFPVTAILSVHSVMQDGSWAEVAGVGKEGMLGVSLFMGGSASFGMSFVRTAGYGYRMKAQKLAEEFKRGSPLRLLLLRYSHALITQINQVKACSRQHSVKQQLCRWLLCSLDHDPAKESILTHEMAANMLGVLHEDITEVAEELQQLGIIRSGDGYISVLDRAGLEDRACECYGVSRTEFDRLHGRGWGWQSLHDGIKPVTSAMSNTILVA